MRVCVCVYSLSHLGSITTQECLFSEFQSQVLLLWCDCVMWSTTGFSTSTDCSEILNCKFLLTVISSFVSTTLVSLPVSRRGRIQHTLLRSGGGNRGDNWEVFWQRLLSGSTFGFSTRRCPGGQGLRDMWETDIKALRLLSGKWQLTEKAYIRLIGWRKSDIWAKSSL